MIDGGKALRKAIKEVFGEHALVHRCQRHKERNVTLILLPERDRDAVRARMRGAWSLTDPELARQRLDLLVTELDRTWPDAAGSLREGMADTLTLMRLGITGKLATTLCSTNPCESMIEIVRHTQRNVKRWQDGDMRSAGPPPACSSPSSSSGGSSATATSPSSSSPSSATPSPPPRRTSPVRRSPSPLPSNRQPRGSPSKFHDDPDNLEPIWFLGIVAVTFMIVGLPVGFVGFIVWLFQGAKPVSQRIEEDRLRTAALERLSG